jgi:hypothetical protein
MNADFIGFRQSVADFAHQAGFLFSAIQRGSYDAEQREALLADLGTTSATLRNAIAGIDVLIRTAAGTNPGEWTSDLLRMTAAIRDDLTLLARNTARPFAMWRDAEASLRPVLERTRQHLCKLQLKVEFLSDFDLPAVIPNTTGIDAKTVEQNGKLAEAIADSSHTKTAEVDEQGGNTPESEFIFRADGDGYFLRGFGEQGHISARGAKGLHDIFRLVKSPRVLVPMLVLDAGEGTRLLNGDEHSRQPVADEETLKSIMAKRNQLKADIKNANSEVERDELREELEKLETEAKKMFGLAGESRDLNNPNDRLRPKLLWRKTSACKLMKDCGLSKLADHFDISIKSADGCLVYSPSINITWDTETKL